MLGHVEGHHSHRLPAFIGGAQREPGGHQYPAAVARTQALHAYPGTARPQDLQILALRLRMASEVIADLRSG